MNLLNGGFPEVLARPRARELWFNSYLQMPTSGSVATRVVAPGVSTISIGELVERLSSPAPRH